MDKATVVNSCLGLIGLLLVQGMLHVDGRSMLNPGDLVFKPSEDAHNKILALLLHKRLAPVEKEAPLGLELVNTLAEVEELRVLSDDLELEKEIAASLARGKSITQKRGEPCFWKYCV